MSPKSYKVLTSVVADRKEVKYAMSERIFEFNEERIPVVINLETRLVLLYVKMGKIVLERMYGIRVVRPHYAGASVGLVSVPLDLQNIVTFSGELVEIQGFNYVRVSLEKKQWMFIPVSLDTGYGVYERPAFVLMPLQDINFLVFGLDDIAGYVSYGYGSVIGKAISYPAVVPSVIQIASGSFLRVSVEIPVIVKNSDGSGWSDATFRELVDTIYRLGSAILA